MDGKNRRSGVRSLDVVEEVVLRERDTQMRHWDALDTKAGVMLGFAGVLAALAPAEINVIVDVGRVIAVAGALLAVWAFWPRGYGAVKLRIFRDRYLASEPSFARLHLTDSHIAAAEELAVTLDQKAARVKWSMTFLATAALLVAIGLVVD